MENTTTCPTNVLESASVPGLMMLLATLIAGGIILVICYVVNRRSRSRQDSQKTTYYGNRDEASAASESLMYIPEAPVPMQPVEFSKKKHKKRRETPQERAHPWMMGTLKGHTGLVNDMDFSSNGRYLASCADDESLRETRKHVQSSGQYHMYKKKESKKKTPSLQTDCKESQSSASREDIETGKASRGRGRGPPYYVQNNKVSEEASSLEVVTSDTSSNDDISDKEQQLLTFLINNPAYVLTTITKYMLSPIELFEHGYPVESISFPNYTRINYVLYPSGPKVESDSGKYSNSSSSDNSEQESSSDNEKNFDNENSPEKAKNLDDKNSIENRKRCDSESSFDEKSLEDKKNCDSESSSDNERSSDDQKSSENEKSYDSGSHSDGEKNPVGKRSSEHEKSCGKESSSNNTGSSNDERCLDKRRLDQGRSWDNESSGFDCDKSPVNKEESGVNGNTGFLERTCVRCQKIFYAHQNGEFVTVERCIYHCGKQYNRMTNDSWYWTCCNQDRFSRGCAEWKTHVWTGLIPGINDALTGYVCTVPSPLFIHDIFNMVYAMDCEMCYTLKGLELTKVTVVDLRGTVVYNTLVKPSSEIIDYNTKFSGITEEDMLKVTKTLPEVQYDLLNLIYAETILIGHGLGNDLRALCLIHKNVVDTTVMFPHYLGLPYRIGLKTLTRRLLNQRIQEETHDSIEDAVAAKNLVLQKSWCEYQSFFSGR